MPVERGLGIKKNFGNLQKHQGQRLDRFFHRRTGVVGGDGVTFNRGDSKAIGGMPIS